MTNGFKLGEVSGTPPTMSTISEAAAKTNLTSDACHAPVAGQFCATRYVYHTAWREVPAVVYKADMSFMGIPRSGVAASTTAQSSSDDPVPGNSYCRQH